MENKNLKKITSLILSLSIILTTTGCYRRKIPLTNTKIPATEIPHQSSTPIPYDEIVRKYQELINEFYSQYKYIDYYPTKEDIDKLINSSHTQTTCSYQIDDLDKEINNLFSKIKNNSTSYVLDKPIFYYELTSNDESTSWQKYVASKQTDNILKNVLKNIFLNATNDINEDICYLQDLKIVFTDEILVQGLQGKFSAQDKLIILYYPVISQGFQILCEEDNLNNKNEQFYNYLSLIVTHEINHARQQMCSHRNSTYPNLNYLSNYVTHIIEASSESVMYNQNMDELASSKDNFSYTYSEERTYEALLLLISISNPSLNDYYNAIFDSDLEKLYSFFGLETKDDIQTFYNIIYSIDSLELRTPLISTLKPEKSFITVGEAKKIIGYNYRVDIFKLALKNLITSTKEKKLTFEENINLFLIIKNYLVQNAYYFEKNNFGIYQNKYDEEFVNNIIYLENIYIEFLSSYFNKSIEYIRNQEELSYDNILYLLATNQEVEDSKEKQKAQKLLEKFPILKAIFFTIRYEENSYDYFLKDNNKEKTYKLTYNKK